MLGGEYELSGFSGSIARGAPAARLAPSARSAARSESKVKECNATLR
jgi:hypothetical protein